MRKIRKYELAIATPNTSFVSIDITKNNYNSLIERYEEIAKDIKEDENIDTEHNFELYNTIEEYEQYIQHTTVIEDDETYINLRMIECKEGYMFW